MGGLLDKHKQNRKLSTLVENRTAYSSEYAELNIYETYMQAENVALTFDIPIIAGMLTGNKIMHLNGLPSFECLPGESVVIGANQKVVIDFPTATPETPTHCVALAIDVDKINEVVYHFNQEVSMGREHVDFELAGEVAAHLRNNEDVNILLHRLIHTFIENTASKKVLLDLMIQELIVRLLQSKARCSILSGQGSIFSDTRIGMVIRYIKDHLTDSNLSIQTLADKAHMSTSHFHKKFKKTLGVSPIEYLNNEKIKFAKSLMKKNTKLYISEIAFKAGFNNVSYFNRQFKKTEMVTPQQFKKSLIL